MDRFLEIILNYIVAPVLGVLIILGSFISKFFSAVMKVVYKRIVEIFAFIIISALIYLLAQLLN